MPLGCCLDTRSTWGLSRIALCIRNALDLLWVKYQNVLSAVCVHVPELKWNLCKNHWSVRTEPVQAVGLC